MELNTFAIVVSTLLLLQVIAILLRIQIVYTVKAGSKDSYHLCFGLNAKKQDYITVNGEKKNISSLTRLLVRGNSMKDFNISNGQTVFVERLSKSASSSICDHPVLVFTLKEEKYPLDSTYKLRKFIAYQNLKNVDWHIVYNTYRERIYIDEEAFVSECKSRRDILKKEDPNFSKKYILSATFLEKENRYHYSIHNVDTVFGQVKYVL